MAGLIQIALGFSYLEPVRASLRISQILVQAIPINGSPLLQLPGVTSTLAWNLRAQKRNPIRTVQDLLRLEPDEQRKALSSLDERHFSQAINVAKQIPILIVSNVHFKGILVV